MTVSARGGARGGMAVGRRGELTWEWKPYHPELPEGPIQAEIRRNGVAVATGIVYSESGWQVFLANEQHGDFHATGTREERQGRCEACFVELLIGEPKPNTGHRADLEESVTFPALFDALARLLSPRAIRELSILQELIEKERRALADRFDELSAEETARGPRTTNLRESQVLVSAWRGAARLVRERIGKPAGSP